MMLLNVTDIKVVLWCCIVGMRVYIEPGMADKLICTGNEEIGKVLN